MKLQTQFTVPQKGLRDLDYVNKVEVLEETFKRECQDYPTKEDCLVFVTDYSLIGFHSL
jgi:hypothetical protein